MKIYLVDYNIDEREPKKIFVSQYSSYKIGINVNGVDNSKIKFSKKSDGKPIAVEEDFKGYNTYSFEASTPEKTAYNIWVPYSNTGITFTLEVITTDSTVAELSSGGGIPTDLEVNSLKTKGDISCTGTFRGKTIQCKGGSIGGPFITCDERLSAPALRCETNENGNLEFNVAASNISIFGDNGGNITLGQYYDDSTTQYVNGFRLYGVSDLIFNLNGNRMKAVPTFITDSSGTSHMVLSLQDYTG